MRYYRILEYTTVILAHCTGLSKENFAHHLWMWIVVLLPALPAASDAFRAAQIL